MINKHLRTFISGLLFLIPCLTKSQNISVESFRLLDNDLTAMTTGTIEHDQNGEVAALIKIVTIGTDYTFDVGSLGVVKTRQMGAEWWVYVPRGVQRITINHPQYGILRNYYLGIPIEGARTYEMVLNPGIGKFTNLVTNQSGSIITMDGDTIGYSPISNYYIFYGNHHFVAKKDRFYGELSVDIDENSPSAINIQLEDQSYLYGHVRVNVPVDVEIWMNGELKHTGIWMTDLKEGTYEIETRRKNCANAYTVIEVKAGENNEFDANVPADIKELQKYSLFKQNRFYLSADCSIGKTISYYGMTVGYSSKKICIELNWSLPFNTNTIKGYYWKEYGSLSVSERTASMFDAYISFDWQYSMAISLKIGRPIQLSRSIRMTPQVGFSFYTLNGTSNGTDGMLHDYLPSKPIDDWSAYDDAAVAGKEIRPSVRSFPIVIKTEYMPNKHLSLFATPSFIYTSWHIEKTLLDSDKRTLLPKGFNLNCGLAYVF